MEGCRTRRERGDKQVALSCSSSHEMGAGTDPSWRPWELAAMLDDLIRCRIGCSDEVRLRANSRKTTCRKSPGEGP